MSYTRINPEGVYEAAVHCETAIKKLNRRTRKCDCCQHTVYEDKEDFKLAMELEAVAGKLRNLWKRLLERDRRRYPQDWVPPLPPDSPCP